MRIEVIVSKNLKSKYPTAAMKTKVRGASSYQPPKNVRPAITSSHPRPKTSRYNPVPFEKITKNPPARVVSVRRAVGIVSAI